MRCIFLSDLDKCAEKMIPIFSYSPSKEELRKYCKNSNFGSCPRYKAIFEIVKGYYKG